MPVNEQWLIMLGAYFGRWPGWINFFIESCKWNPTVRWRFYTDCGHPENTAANVEFVHLSLDDYIALVNKRLRITFNPGEPNKLSDLKACLAYIHEPDVEGFPFFGFGDIDVIWGDIRGFYTDEVLSRFDVLSTHPERLSGHFAVFRNTPDYRRAFKRVRGYRKLLEAPRQVSFDEERFSHIVSRSLDPVRRVTDRLGMTSRRQLFVERYSTVLSPRGWHDGTMNYPQRWFWRDGKLTNEHDGEREFLYLHFMRWQSERWIADPPAEGEGAWLRLPKIVIVDWQRAAAEGFCISPKGFTESKNERGGSEEPPRK